MIQLLLYLFLIAVLVWWVESPILAAYNPLNLKHPAEELEDWLKKFHWGNRAQLGTDVQLPQYKFYHEVVEVLLGLARKLGGSYQDSILFLREGLKDDRQFEKKLKEVLTGTWLQMGLMVLLTWGFIFGALTLATVKVGLFPLLGILLWQSLGLGLLPMILRHYRQQFFGDIGKLWKMLYVLRSLVRVPLSRSEILVLAGVENLETIRQKNLSHIVQRLQEACQKAREQGASYEGEVTTLMEELRFQEKWHFELFEKRLSVVKLGLLSIFFLPSYLAFMFLLLQDLLTHM